MSALELLKRSAAAPMQQIARRYSATARLSSLLSSALPPLTCIDVGASYYPHPKWRLLLESPAVRWVAVEPNVANIGYIEHWEWPCKVTAVTTGLSRTGGAQTLYVTNVDSGSSLLEPRIPAAQAHRFRDLGYFFPVQPRPIDTLTLQAVIDAHAAGPVLVKLDTQGTELSIVSGAETAVADRRVIGVELESTLLAQPVMQGSGKFWEACRYFEERGFELLHIKVMAGASRMPRKHARANTFLNECDAVFALRRDVAADLPVEHRTALFAFYLCNKLFDEAHDLLEADTALRSYLQARGCDIQRLAALIDKLS